MVESGGTCVGNPSARGQGTQYNGQRKAGRKVEGGSVCKGSVCAVCGVCMVCVKAMCE